MYFDANSVRVGTLKIKVCPLKGRCAGIVFWSLFFFFSKCMKEVPTFCLTGVFLRRESTYSSYRLCVNKSAIFVLHEKYTVSKRIRNYDVDNRKTILR